jgi:hypothetical protein
VEGINNMITMWVNGQKLVSFAHTTDGVINNPGWRVINSTRVGFDNLVVEQHR